MKSSLVSIMSLCTLIFSPSVFAEDEVANCAKAKITSAQKCDEVKVKFDLSECGGSNQKTLTAQVVCDKDKATATVEHKGYVYSTSLRQTWGENWALSGGIKRKSLGSGAPAVEAAPAAQAAAPVAVAATPTASSPLKFSGFADLRHTTFSVSKDDPNLTIGRAESGFGVEDGAFYVNYEKEKVSFVMDIAFRRFKDKDPTPDGTASLADRAEQSRLSNIAFGVDKTQIFVKYKLKDGLNFNIGQFDTIFGVELNDSKDRVFGKTGLVYDVMLPVTHTGVMFDYTNNGVYTKLFAANAANRGSYTAAADNGDEFGLAVGYSGEMFRGQAGYMGRAVVKADGGTNKETRSLTDFTFGLTSGQFAVDFEYAIIKDPSKNTLTSSINTDLEDSGTGAFVLASYKANDELSFGVRYEKIEKDPGAASLKTITDTGLSVHYKLSSDLELRSDYITYNYENLSNLKWTNSRFYIGTLFTF